MNSLEIGGRGSGLLELLGPEANILELEGIPVDQQRVVFGQTALEDGSTLPSYSIHEGALLCVAMEIFCLHSSPVRSPC